MSATLNPGIKAVHLVLSRPTYRRPNDTTDIRDDLISVKVWYSKMPINPDTPYNAVDNAWILYSDNGGLLTTIDGLDEDTTYYVRYAYISKIDPSTYTISNQLSVKTLAAGVHVYGWLTNDPVNISTDSAGVVLVTVNNALVTNPSAQQQQTAWTSATQGVFEVYNDNARVTGANTTTLANDGSPVGPRYNIKAGSYTGDLTSSNTVIDNITGAFYCTGVGVTNYNNSVIFQAKYNGVTIERTWTVTKGRGGQTAPIIQLSANTTEFIYKQEIDTTSVTTSSIIKARLANITGQIAVTAYAYTRSGSLLGAISGSQDQVLNTFTITAAQFGYYGITTGYVLVTATSVSDNSVSDTITLYRINDGSNQITVEQSNGAHLITADATGTANYNDYDGSGNTISVKKGNKLLLIDNTPGDSYAADTWRVQDVLPNGISYDQSYIANQGDDRATFSRASNMTANVAYIDYVIRVQQIAGNGNSASQYLDTTVRQSFAKSKAGATGRGVNLTSNYANFTTASGSTTISPSTIVLTATASQYVNPTYTWSIDGSTTFTGATQGTGANVNKLTLNSFAGGNPVPTKLIRVTVTETINGITHEQFDELSIGSLKEGDPGISYNLTNGNQTIYYDSTGNIKAGQLDGTLNTTSPPNFKCVYQVKRGTTTLNGTSAVTFSKASQVGMTADIDASTGVISVATLISEFASATFYATIGGQVYTQILTLNRSQDGASAPVINLSGPKGIAFVKAIDNTWSPSTITLSADVFNIPLNTTYYWYVAVNDGSFTALTNGVDLKQYTVAQFTSGTKTYKIEATVNGQLISDTQTVYTLESGSGGLAIGLANPTQSISSSSAGVPVSNVSITTSLVVYKGTDPVSSGLTFSATAYSGLNATGIANYTNTINSTNGNISVPSSYFDTSSSVNQITITYRVTGTNIDASRTLVINKTRDGTDGKSTYTATVYIKSSDYTISNPPNAPIGGSYDFSLGILTAPSGWSTTQPDSDSVTPTFAASYTFVATTVGATVTGGTWTNIRIVALNGAQSTTPGPRNSSGYLYYQVSTSSSTSASSIPTPDINTATWNWATASFTTTSNWSYNVFTPAAGEKAWAVRYTVTQTTYSGPISVTYSTAFTSLTFDGLVTFTNNLISNNSTVTNKVDANGAASAANTAISNSLSSGGSLYNALSGKADTSALNAKADSANVFKTNTTQIDGGKIATDSISAGSLKIGTIPQNANGNYIKMEDSRIVVYSSNQPRVIIGDLSL